MAERTKIWIANTLKRMLRKKPIEEIRVTEICREAEIERPTFYYHFKDKYELMAWAFFQSTYAEDVLDVESAAHSMNQMRQDVVFYRRAFEDRSQNPMWAYIVEYYVERYSNKAKEKVGTDTLDTQLLYSIRLYCHGAVGMTREWLMKDNITPAETIVQMMFNSMPETLKKLYFGQATYNCRI